MFSHLTRFSAKISDWWISTLTSYACFVCRCKNLTSAGNSSGAEIFCWLGTTKDEACGGAKKGR